MKYADDTNFIITIRKCDNDVESKLLQILNHVQEWCSANHMILNANKTKILNISFSIDPFIPDSEFIYAANFVNSIKLLGITFDHKLTFDHHINNIIKTCSQRIYALRIFKHVLTNDDLKTVFCATIQLLLSDIFKHFCS